MSRTDRSVRVALIDDQTIFREMLQEILVLRSRCTVVGQFPSGTLALDRIPTLDADIVILDLILPDIHGLDVLRELKRLGRPPRVLVVTACEQPTVIHDALVAGANGIVTKGAPLHELRLAVERVGDNATYFCEASSELLRHGARAKAGHRPTLTRRERVVLQRVASGSTSKEIASDLGVTEKTVHNHRHNIRRKLGIETTAGLIRFAVTQGLIATEE